MKHLKYILLTAVIVVLAYGASCPPKEMPVPRTSPEKNLKVMREALEKSDYSTAYYCLSKDTRGRYKYGDFKMMLEYTIFGVLIRSILVYWEVEDIKYFRETITSEVKPARLEGSGGDESPTGQPSGPPKIIEKARVRLRHWKHPDYQKEFVFIFEEDGWRIDFTLASIVGVPQEDEDAIAPPPKEKKNKND
ncbi:MAG: hypothetical protein AB1599_07835 [Planctomycetota bacterium]